MSAGAARPLRRAYSGPSVDSNALGRARAGSARDRRRHYYPRAHRRLVARFFSATRSAGARARILALAHARARARRLRGSQPQLRPRAFEPSIRRSAFSVLTPPRAAPTMAEGAADDAGAAPDLGAPAGEAPTLGDDAQACLLALLAPLRCAVGRALGGALGEGLGAAGAGRGRAEGEHCWCCTWWWWAWRVTWGGL